MRSKPQDRQVIRSQAHRGTSGNALIRRIGIDYTPAYEQGGGIGRYVRELVAALAQADAQTDYRLFVMGAGNPTIDPFTPSPPSAAPPARSSRTLPPLPGPNFRWATSRLTPTWFARLWGRARLPIPVERWVGAVQLYHATDFVLPPTRPTTRTLLTVHDLSFVRVPGSASPSLKRYLDAVVPRSVRRADHVLADSQATKDDLIVLYRTPAEKITVLLSGVNPRFDRTPIRAEDREALRARYQIGDWPFVLAVGTVQPRKNYERLIRALAALPPDLAETRLVIAGGKGWLDAPIYRTVADLGLAERVVFTGFLDDALLPALYKSARCLAFPSLYEGFGLPILEAMACGVPVLTANLSSTAEVAGNAALLIDPYSVDALREALVALLTDDALRERLVAAGALHAAQFTWARAAAELQAAYARLVL